MARIDTVPNFCTDIANAIRKKTGTTDKILAKDFDTKIDEISSGIDINGIIEQYKVSSAGNVNAGDFVEFLNGVNSSGNVKNRNLYQINNARQMSAVILDSNNTTTKVFMAYNYNYYVYGCVLTIDNSSNSITAPSATTIRRNNIAGANIISEVHVKKLSSTKVCVIYDNSSNYSMAATVCDISGTTITVGTYTVLDSTYHGGYNISAQELSNNKIFIAHNYQANNDYASLNGLMISISGTTITLGTHKQIAGYYNPATYLSTAKVIENNVEKVVVTYALCSSSTTYDYYLTGKVIVPNGTNFSMGTETRLENTSGYGKYVQASTLYDTKVATIHYGLSRTTVGTRCTILNISGTSISVENDSFAFATDSSKYNLITLNEETIAVIYIGTANTLYVNLCKIESSGVNSILNSLLNSQDDSITYKVIFSMALNEAKILIFNTLFKSTSNSATIFSEFFDEFVKTISSSSESIFGIAIESGTPNTKIQVKRPNI